MLLTEFGRSPPCSISFLKLSILCFIEINSWLWWEYSCVNKFFFAFNPCSNFSISTFSISLLLDSLIIIFISSSTTVIVDDIFSFSSIIFLISSFNSFSSLVVLLFSFNKAFSPSIFAFSSITFKRFLFNSAFSNSNLSNLLLSSKYLASFLLLSFDIVIISLSIFSFLCFSLSCLLWMFSISYAKRDTSYLSNPFLFSRYSCAFLLCFFNGPTWLSNSVIISFTLSMLLWVLSNFLRASSFLFLYFNTPDASSNIIRLSWDEFDNILSTSPCEIILNDSFPIPESNNRLFISFNLHFSLFR